MGRPPRRDANRLSAWRTQKLPCCSSGWTFLLTTALSQLFQPPITRLGRATLGSAQANHADGTNVRSNPPPESHLPAILPQLGFRNKRCRHDGALRWMLLRLAMPLPSPLGCRGVSTSSGEAQLRRRGGQEGRLHRQSHRISPLSWRTKSACVTEDGALRVHP